MVKRAMLAVSFFSLVILLSSCNTTTQTTTTTTTTTTSSTTSTTLSGLVAHYAFNDGSGTTAGDSSGNNLNGTVIGGTWTTGRSDGALEFDGTDDYVRIPAAGQTAPTQIADLSEGSIAIWFKFDGTAGTSGIFYPVFYQGPDQSVSDTHEGLIIEVGHKGIWNSSQELFYTVTLSGSSEPILCFDSHDDLTDNQWYHFVVTVSSSGNTGYLNGQEMTNRDYNFDDASGTQFLSTVTDSFLAIGCGRSAIDKLFYYFKGTVDDVQIYDRALSASEVQQLYQ